MLAFPVAKLEDARRLYQEVRRPAISSAVAGPDLLVISTQQHPGCSPQVWVLDSRRQELNRQILELKHCVTYTKHTLAYQPNRQKMQKRSRALSVRIDASQAPSSVHSHQGPR